MRRPSTRAIGAAFSVVLAVLVPSIAVAQTPREAAAAAVFQRGANAMQTRHFDEAIRLFTESYRITPATNSLYNIAHCYRELGRARLAIEFYERYLQEAGAEVPAARETAVRLLIVDLRGRLAVVTARVQPADATVTVDGTGVVPRNGEFLLDPGEHVVEFAAAHHANERRAITARAGVTLTLDVLLTRTDAPVLGVGPTVDPSLSAMVTSRGDRPVADEPSRPIYARWWFWTGVAVVVAGGVTAAVLATTHSAEPHSADLYIDTIVVH